MTGPTARDVDEVDVALLDALHANPRASFERLGPAVGISPATAARRWQRLTESGRAWVSSVPGPSLSLVAAVYEVRAQPGRILDVARALAAIPQVISVYATDGLFDLQTLVFAGDTESLSTLLLDRLPRTPGIGSARAHVGINWYSGIHWRLGALDSAQQRLVAADADEPARATRGRSLGSADRTLFVALQRDGRARHRDLAAELGLSEHAVRRRIDALTRNGMLGFRTDFARGEGGWQTEQVLWLSVPHLRLHEAGREVARWPQTRICMSTVGAANLMVMSQVHRIAGLTETLDRVRDTLPDVSVIDQRLVLRACKSWGRLLDPAGHAVGVVPVDPWADAAG